MQNEETKVIKFAILDLNAGHPNQGMRCIKEILENWAEESLINIEYDIFDVRVTDMVPDMSYDIYISSGGPGDPLNSRFEDWDIKWMNWFDNLLRFNKNPKNTVKKYAFLICHSFQLATRYLNLGLVCKRRTTSFGVFPIHMLEDGKSDPIFENLKDPFYAVDSRDYQVIQPNHKRIDELGAYITCIEKNRPHVPFERAVMGIRFSEEVFGTQFHPEADATGMLKHFQSDDKKETVIKNHGKEKLTSMMDQLEDPDKIVWTNKNLIPNFLNSAYHHIMAEEMELI